MILLKPFVLLIGFAAAVLFVQVGLKSLEPIWNRRIARYSAWIVKAYKHLEEPVETAWAERFITVSIFAPFAVFWLLTAWPIGVLAASAGAAAPYAWVRYRLYLHKQAMDNQLVDVLILMANSLKSGLSLLQAVELGATESKKPIVSEFEKVLKEVQLGQSIDHALMHMSERAALPDLEMAVHSIVTLRETGGNLSETFMTVAHTIVERKKVEGKIGSLTAQGLYQGFAMCAMPFIMGGMFYLMDPNYMNPMLTTGLGWAMWVAVIVLDSLGMWAILKIVDIDV
ncbi:MAG: type II secretion system F family protein [Acidobacteria bacterium]|nr:type II secretion system F family protein [Acidobacteriota bacterium]